MSGATQPALARLAGPHVNKFGETVEKTLLARRPGVVKLLETAADALSSPDLRGLWPATDLILRHTFPSEQLDDSRVDDFLRTFERSHSVGARRLIGEVPVNEGFQSGEGLLRYAEWTVRVAERLHGEGFVPAIGNFSTGNPPDIEGGVRAFEPAIEECRKFGAVYSTHEYWLPGNQLDGWNPLRYRKFYALLKPENRIDLYVTESGIDRINNSSTRGWRTYSPTEPPSKAEWYRDQILAYLTEVARDPYVRGVLLYCMGQFGDWWDFDYDGEDAITETFSRTFARPAATTDPEPTPQEPPVALDPTTASVLDKTWAAADALEAAVAGLPLTSPDHIWLANGLEGDAASVKSKVYLLKRALGAA